MKNEQKKQKKEYTAPAIEELLLRTEKGFAATDTSDLDLGEVGDGGSGY